MKIIVFGASGFAGRAVVDRLSKLQDVELVAAINSDGNAWYLARDTSIQIKRVNILDKQSLQRALSGVTHVVNCTRGSDEVMTVGFRNLVDAALAAGVSQFVHMSSVLIYGDRPSPQACNETAKPDPQNNLYGQLKLKQDQYLQAAVRKGLKANIICPPNIIGPGSYFLDGLLTMLNNNRFALLDSGEYACSTVDVANVAKAIELALLNGDGTGSLYMVTDGENVTWRQLLDELMPLVPGKTPYQTTPAELEERTRAVPVSLNPFRSMRHLVSSDVREALRKDPLLCKVDLFFRGLVAKLPGAVEDKIRLSVEGHQKVSKIDPLKDINWTFCASQLRNVYHSCGKLERELQYKPAYTFRQSMEAYRAHYSYIRGFDTQFADLLRLL